MANPEVDVRSVIVHISRLALKAESEWIKVARSDFNVLLCVFPVAGPMTNCHLFPRATPAGGRVAEAAKWIKVEVAPERLPRCRLCNLLDTAVLRVCRPSPPAHSR